jgi:NAD(P)-dependent dehydrogenase (short-subunit alcohol dehydrogenase family)
MKKKLLFVGSNSFLARKAIQYFNKDYNIITLGRKDNSNTDLHLDFNNISLLDSFSLQDGQKFDGVLFFQGLNPSTSLKETSYEHFLQMFNVNVLGPAIFLRNIYNHINDSGLVLFFTSIATKKGSYDPAYAASKSAILGLIKSLSHEFTNIRFNSISLGLVQGSPVFNNMTPDYREKHSNKMYNNTYIDPKNVLSMISEILINKNINNADFALDGGYN